MDVYYAGYGNACCSSFDALLPDKKGMQFYFTRAMPVNRKSKIIPFGQFPMSLGSDLYGIHYFREYTSLISMYSYPSILSSNPPAQTKPIFLFPSSVILSICFTSSLISPTDIGLE